MNRWTHLQWAVRVAMAAGFLTIPGLGRAQAPPSLEETREANLRAYVDLLRSDVRAQSTAIISEMMQLNDADEKAFWPVYRAFEADLIKLNDTRVALIKEYADNYGALTDAVADTLARRALDLEGQRTDLKKKYYDRFRAVVPAKVAARFLQIENQILLLLDLQIAASLPIVE
jgi:hypothetical protein